MRRILPLLACLTLAMPLASAQTPAEALRAAAAKMSVADLPDGSRAVSLGGSDLSVFSLYGLAGLGRGGGNAGSALDLMSLIGVTFVDPDEFSALLEGKRARVRGFVLDMTAMIREATKNPESSGNQKPIFMETWIEGGKVIQWTPRPGITKEALLKAFSTTPGVEAMKAETISNGKQVGLGIALYCADNDDHFPNADSTAKAQKLVYPYLKNNDVWKSKNPEGGRLLYNTSLSRKALSRVGPPYQTPLLWDENAWPDGGRVVVFVDGHSKYVSGNEWNGNLWPLELARRGGNFAVPMEMAVPDAPARTVTSPAVVKKKGKKKP